MKEQEDPKFKHAIVDYKIPLIGIHQRPGLKPVTAAVKTIGLSQSVFTGTQMLCPKCAKP